jgi:hypothetical protein
MQLGEVIAVLEAEVAAYRDRALPLGYANQHSYRGYDECLAFETAENVTTGQMLAEARTALGTTYGGWKGGEYTMDAYTDCYLAERGCCGEELSAPLLRLMLAGPDLPERLVNRIMFGEAR